MNQVELRMFDRAGPVFLCLKGSSELRVRLAASGREQAIAEHADAEVTRLLDLRLKALVELFARRAA